MKQKYSSKLILKEFAGELVGTAVMVFYGLCGSALNILSENVSPYTGPIAFGFGVTFAMLISGQISGGHVNPAFSLAATVIGQLAPWWRLLYYLVAQFAGAFIGSGVVYLLYRPSIAEMETRLKVAANLTENSHQHLLPTTAIFITAPASSTSLPAAIADQVVITMVVVMVVFFAVDERCHRTPFVLQALVVGLIMASMNLCASFNADAIFNPARDFSPRLLLCLLGYGDIVWSSLGGHFWWAAGLLAPAVGGVFGAFGYYFLAKLRKFPTSVTEADCGSITFSLSSDQDNFCTEKTNL